MTTTVRWGLVGTGNLANRTIRDIRLTENADLVAVVSRNQHSADAFAETWGIPTAYGDYSEFLAASDIDLVYIGTPHGTHFDYAKQAIEAGKNVLCEKAFTLTAADARELARLAHEHGVFLMEAMWMRFSPALERIHQLISSGAIGDIRFIQAGMGFAHDVVPGGRFHTPELGGGAILDMGIYPLTLAHHFLGAPERISAIGEMWPNGIDLDELMTLEYSSGAVARLASSISYMLPRTAAIGGTGGVIEIDEPFWAATSIRLRSGTDAPEVIAIEVEGAGYVPMFRAVGETLLAGKLEHPTNPLSATISVLETVDEVRRLLAEQQPQ
ncbi:MAG: Gfo/Idh/MocA family oxidoreductase [Salinibacterium sp.]|nr:Gfo/Idh/MocA family oxidoreductase [Salinibacterium sp.]